MKTLSENNSEMSSYYEYYKNRANKSDVLCDACGTEMDYLVVDSEVKDSGEIPTKEYSSEEEKDYPKRKVKCQNCGFEGTKVV